MHLDDPLGPPHTPPGTGLSQTTTNLYHSRSNPDLTSLYCYDDTRAPDYPEHVLKVYKADQSCKYLLVNKETTAHEVSSLLSNQSLAMKFNFALIYGLPNEFDNEKRKIKVLTSDCYL